MRTDPRRRVRIARWVMQAPAGREDTSGGFAHGGWWRRCSTRPSAKIDTLFDNEFDLLLGRGLYEILPGTGRSARRRSIRQWKFDHADKYLLTKAGTDLDWPTTTAGRPRRAGENQAGRRTTCLQAARRSIRNYSNSGLLDRMVLMIAPVTLGSGKRLFGEGTPPRRQAGRAAHGGRGAVDRDLRTQGAVETGSLKRSRRPISSCSVAPELRRATGDRALRPTRSRATRGRR